MYEVTLNGVSSEEGETASIGLKTDVESLTENINTLVRGYNSFLRAASEYSDKQPKSSRLVHELGSIPRTYAQGLTAAGLNLNLGRSSVCWKVMSALHHLSENLRWKR